MSLTLKSSAGSSRGICAQRLERTAVESAVRVSSLLTMRSIAEAVLTAGVRSSHETTQLRHGALMVWWEIRSTKAFTDVITSVLAADGDARQRVRTLRLEFFCTTDGGCVDRLIAAAVGAWGVDDLMPPCRCLSLRGPPELPQFRRGQGCRAAVPSRQRSAWMDAPQGAEWTRAPLAAVPPVATVARRLPSCRTTPPCRPK